MKHESEKDKKSMTYEEWDKANKDFIDQTFSSPADGNHEVAKKRMSNANVSGLSECFSTRAGSSMVCLNNHYLQAF